MKVVLFCNWSQPPFSNNLLGPVRAFGRLAETRVLEPSAFPGFVSTGGARPAPVPAGLVAEAAGLDPDVVICVAGGLVVAPEDRRRFRSGAVFAGLALSDPIGMEASLEIAPSFDLYYTHDPHTIARYRERGVAVRRCDPAIDAELFHPEPGGSPCDLVFVGKWTARRDRLVGRLASRLDVRVFTHRGETRWTVPAEGPLDTPEALRRAVSSARLALECATVDDAAGEFEGTARLTNRPQIAAACGTPSLVEEFDLLREYFEPGVEVETYRDDGEALDKAVRLLADPARREAMGAAARARVLAEHTWDRRAEAILKDAAALLASRATG